MPTVAPLATASGSQELDLARQNYEAARVKFDQVIEALSVAECNSDREVRAVHEALSALATAEAQFHQALRVYAQSIRDRARSV